MVPSLEAPGWLNAKLREGTLNVSVHAPVPGLKPTADELQFGQSTIASDWEVLVSRVVGGSWLSQKRRSM